MQETSYGFKDRVLDSFSGSKYYPNAIMTHSTLFLSRQVLITIIEKYFVMGVTLHYRATLKDKAKIDCLSTEIVDIAKCMNWPYLVMKGDWSEHAVSNGSGMPLRGISFQVHPKAEWLDLIFDPQGRLCKPIMHAMGTTKNFDSWIWVKTQFAGAETHMAIVRLLQYLKGKYLPDLQVHDEGGYWESGNRDALQARIQKYNDRLNVLEENLRKLPMDQLQNEDKLLERIEEVLRRMKEK